MLVVSDTSPISALLQIGRAELLKDLFGAVCIPPAVKDELARLHTAQLRLDSANNPPSNRIINKWPVRRNLILLNHLKTARANLTLPVNNVNKTE